MVAKLSVHAKSHEKVAKSEGQEESFMGANTRVKKKILMNLKNPL